ncbi:hypothetical protein [Nocardia nova]|jgi:transketolase|uniref:hypothetical protein n=1 Tax=Nocardia nova TaxID=37330 RepID=UPI0025B0A606|nr:hypothetical protein [Nocardia nova]
MTTSMTTAHIELAGRLAAQMRVDSIRCSTRVGSGRPTSSLSAADLTAVLMVGHLHYDWHRPDLPVNDHLIFPKGHASPLLYSMFRAADVVDENELIKTYRQLGSRLQGHPTPVLPWVDVATGSLGQGLPDAVEVCFWQGSAWTSCPITCGCCAGRSKNPTSWPSTHYSACCCTERRRSS